MLAEEDIAAQFLWSLLGNVFLEYTSTTWMHVGLLERLKVRVNKIGATVSFGHV